MFPAVFNLTDLNGTNGFATNVIDTGGTGISASGAGDVNGDGIADIIIGSPGVNNYAGQSYLIFGSKDGFTTPFNLTNLNGTNGFVINGIRSLENSGWSVSGAGDVNGDGIADIAISARYVNLNSATGGVYVIFGSKSEFTTPFNLADLNGNNGFSINEINSGDSSGWSVSEAVDVNNDGITDIIIGAPFANSYAGQSYVIFGNKSGFTTPFNLTDLNGNNCFAINGINSGDESGSSVSGAGDVNNDGIADIIIGAPGYGIGAGQSYVIFGSKNGFTTPFNLTDLNGSNGFAINGINKGDQSGSSVSGAGDVNNDGIADIIIGASGYGIGAGQSYVIFGSKNGFTTPFNLTHLNGNNGFVINGMNSPGQSGISVSGAGDVNDDGIADIIIGASDGIGAGQSYVIFGMGNPVPLASSSSTPSPSPTASLSFGASPSNTPSSSATPSPTPTASLSFGASPSNTPEPTPSHNNVGDNHELSVGAIAGIAVGAAAGVALLGAGLAWYGKTHGWWCAGEHSHDDVVNWS